MCVAAQRNLFLRVAVPETAVVILICLRRVLSLAWHEPSQLHRKFHRTEGGRAMQMPGICVA